MAWLRGPSTTEEPSDMPPRITLTQPLINTTRQQSREGNKPINLSDPAQPGLQLRCYPSGKAPWYALARDPVTQRKCWARLGEYPGMSISQARDAARKARDAITQGNNPTDMRRQERAKKAAHELSIKKEIEELKKKQEQTLNYMLSFYEPHAPKSYPRNKSSIIHVFGEILDQPINEITRQRLNARAKLYPSESVSNQAVRMLQSAIRWGTDHLAWVPESLRQLKQPHPQQKRKQILFTNDMAKILPFFRVSIGHGQAMWLIAHTGCRREEATNMEWNQIDFENSKWTIPGQTRKNTKNKSNFPDLVITLPPVVMEMLKEIKATSKTPHVFTIETKKLNNWGRYAKKIIEQTGVYHTRHDLRHSFKTELSDLGIPAEVSELALGHILQGIQGTYDHATRAPQRKEALQKLANHFQEIQEQGAL